MMGSPENEPNRNSVEGPQHQVAVSRFYIGKYEVTQAQWRAVMGNNPSYYSGDNLPAENILWNEAKDFCRRLSEMTGAEYRLPSEAEWEYACRAGETGAYASDPNATAWYDINSNDKTHPVGQKRPNEFGLYDMLGNVVEWCEDTWHNSYANAAHDASAWLESGGDNRVARGCSFRDMSARCRSAYRDYWSLSHGRNANRGFRLAKTIR